MNDKPTYEELKEENEQLRKALKTNEQRSLKIGETLRIISSRFAGEVETDRAVNASLADMGELTGASRVYLFLISEDGKVMDNTHEWCASGIKPEINNLKNLSTDTFPWWMKKLRRGETIHIRNVLEMPEEAKTEKDFLEAQDIKSLLVLPVYIENKLRGFIGFDDVSETGDWPEEHTTLLQTSSQIIVNALEQKQAEKKIEILYENLPDVVYFIDREGVVREINEAVKFLSGFNKAEFIGAHFQNLSLFSEESLDKLKEVFEKRRKGEELPPDLQPPFIVDYKTINGEVRYGEINQAFIPETREGMGVIRDITNRKKAEDALKEESEAREILLENIPTQIWYLTDERTYGAVNKAHADFNGDSIEALSYQELHEIYPEDVAEICIKGNREVFSTGKTIKTEEWVPNGSGEERLLSIMKTPKLHKDGNIEYVVCSAEDITENKRMEKALAESEAKYRSLIQNSNDAIYLLYNRKFEVINSKFEQMFGYTQEEVNKPDFDFIKMVAPKSRAIIEDRIERLRKGENLESRYEFTALSRDGRELEVETSITYIPYKDGKATQGIIRNITERKRAEEALRESEQKYKKLFYETPLGNFHYDKEGIITECNEKFVDIIGSSKEALIGLNLIKELDNDKMIEEVKSSLIKGEGYYEGDYTSVTGGKTTTVKVFYKGMQNEEGEIYAGVGLVEDITERKRAEEKLIEARNQAESTANKFRTLVEQSSEMLILHDLDGRIIEVNQATENHTGYSREELYSMNIGDVDPNARETKFWKSLSVSDPPTSFESTYKSKEGTIYQAEVVISKIVLENKKYILGLLRDITERKQAEEQLIKSKEQAEESDRLKSAFLANMSHEIRTPMNGIIGLTQMLTEEEFSTDEQKEFFDIINSRVQHLLHIINDLVDVSKIEANQLTLEFQHFHLNDVMQELYTIFSNELANREKDDIQLKLHLGLSYEESYIESDFNRFRQVMDNLLSNAIKFTREGTIEFGCEFRDEDRLLFYVKDSGVGIPKDQQENIFERFRQVDDSTLRTQEGTGLGLTISKNLVEMMGGDMWMTSKKGEGSVFYFTLPYVEKPKMEKEKEKEKEAEQGFYNKEDKTLLLIEDDQTSRKYLSKLLEPNGFNLITCETGREGYEAFVNNPRIDLILMDIKLPDTDGLELTRKIRASSTNKEVPIIAETAYAMSGDAKKSKDAGCDDYISKPIGKKELLAKISKFL